MNAMIHGIYAGPRPIRGGVFEEDPEEIHGFTVEVVVALYPRNELETIAARRVARIALQAERLDRYAAHELARAGTIDETSRLLPVRASPETADEELVCDEVLNRAFEKITALDARLGREYERALNAYRKIRKLIDTTPWAPGDSGT